ELAEPRKPSTKPAETAAPAAPVDVDESAARTRRIRFIALASCVLLGLSAGGFFLYRHHAQRAARHAEISEQLAASPSAFGARDSKRWERAAAAALKVLELEPRLAAAAGLAAEAMLADSIAYGLNATGKAARARALLATALADGLAGPELERAQAL